MRHILNLIETTIDNNIFKKAVELLDDIVNSSNNSIDTFLYEYKDQNDYDEDMDDYDEDMDDHILANSSEFLDWLTHEMMDRIQDAYYTIEHYIKGDHIIGYRMITAPKDWKPDNTKHPGIYWSWDERAAEAHWGSFDNKVNWLITAKIPISSIDWPITLAQNASPDYTEEKEIRISRDAPVTIIKYEKE